VSNRTFVVFISVVFALGLAAGFKLSEIPRLESHKLLNVIGLFYDFLGVMVFWEKLTSSSTWKRICVDVLAPRVLWFHTTLPLGTLVGALVAAVSVHGPSWSTVSKFAGVFWSYSIIPLLILDAKVAFPRLPAFKTMESRWQWFGLFLLLSGIASQLIAALLGLRAS
jgi:hypothetical protein